MVPFIFGLKLKRQMFSKLSKAPQQAEQADEPRGAAAAQEGGRAGMEEIRSIQPPIHILPLVGRGPEVADETEKKDNADGIVDIVQEDFHLFGGSP